MSKTVGPPTIAPRSTRGSPISARTTSESSGTSTGVEGLDVRWHFIGALQSSTAHHVADLADVVHTVGGEHAAASAGAAGRLGPGACWTC